MQSVLKMIDDASMGNGGAFLSHFGKRSGSDHACAATPPAVVCKDLSYVVLTKNLRCERHAGTRCMSQALENTLNE